MIVDFPFSKELQILFKILNKDDELRLVGGCVRDFLNNQISSQNQQKTIHDIDLACKFRPEITMEILQKNQIKAIPTGINHGTITAIINDKTFEITTLRQDIENFGRHAKVEFTDDFKIDAQRRDFTINAMSINANGELFDYFDGLQDLKNKKVRFIGDAKSRISEDYLRILRFFRFSCYYSNSLDEQALNAIITLKKHLKELSFERIRDELTKIIICPNHQMLLQILELMQKEEILSEIISSKHSHLKYLDYLLKSQENAPFLLKFLAFIYSDKEKTLEIANILKFSNKEKNYLTQILELLAKIKLDISKTDLIKLLFQFEKSLIIDAFYLHIATTNNSNISSSDDFDKSKKEQLNKIIKLINSLKLPNFIINGNDLLEIGLKGKDIGIALEKLRNLWIESDFEINKSQLLEIASK